VSGHAVVTLVALVAMLVLLLTERFPPVGVLLAGLAGLVLAGVLEPEEGFSGFSSSAPLTVAALYVVAGAARRTGLLVPLTTRVLGGEGGRASLLRLTVPVAGVSTVFNNTPLVAMLLPEVSGWARRHGVPASRFLMPLSFAAILGGAVTVIGTSTNLVVSGVLEQQGLAPFAFFELAPVGLPVAVIGLAVLVALAPRLLPDRGDPADDALEALRSYAVQLEVAAGGALDGHTVADGGLRSLSGVYLADIIRGDVHLGPVSPAEVLRGGDVCVFVGDVGDVIDLRSRTGLRSPADHDRVLADTRSPRYFEAVVGRGSPLVGNTLKEVGGRDGYRAAAIAINRAGERVGGKLGEVELRPGDMLVLLADRDLRSSRRAVEDFLLIAPVDDTPAATSRGAAVVAGAIVAFVVLAATGVLSTLEAAIVAAGAVVGGRVLTFTDAKRSIDLDVVVMVATALGIGTAVETSGLAAELARGASDAFAGFGTWGLVFGVLAVTSLLTGIVTNNAAAAVIVPIAIRTAEASALDPRVMAVGVAVLASASFLTPIGYQTNAMVYGPGGYRFADFLRLGGPLNLVVVLATTTLVVALG